jgi:hypothetical protein
MSLIYIMKYPNKIWFLVIIIALLFIIYYMYNIKENMDNNVPDFEPRFYPAPATCSGSGWTDNSPSTAPGGVNYPCANEYYMAASDGSCPRNYVNKKGICFDPIKLQSSDVTTKPPEKCSGDGWTDNSPSAGPGGRHYGCSIDPNYTNYYMAAPGGYCPLDYNNKDGVCIPP